MSSNLKVLVITAVAFHGITRTLTGLAEPLDTNNWSQSHLFLHRVEKSLERMEDGVIKDRIKDFVDLHLFLCTFNDEVNDDCVSGITVAVMAYIHHQTTGESFEYEYDTDE